MTRSISVTGGAVFFEGVQFRPVFRSRPERHHLLSAGFVRTALAGG